MVNNPKQFVDPTEAALSAIREALKAPERQSLGLGSGDPPSLDDALVTATKKVLSSGELGELTAWLHRELRNVATQLDRIASASAVIEHALAGTGVPTSVESESKQSRPELTETLTRMEEALRLSGGSSTSEQPAVGDKSVNEARPQFAELETSYQASAELDAGRAMRREIVEVGLDRLVKRLERDLLDSTIGVSQGTLRHSGEKPRELDYRELVFRLHLDVLELAVNSPEAKIRAAVGRSRAIARKLVGAEAFAHRAPLAERYYPDSPEPRLETPAVRILRIGELPNDVVTALERAEMDPRHAHLDSLLEE